MSSRRILVGIMRKPAIRVREGQAVGQEVSKSRGCFPELSVEMIEVGESTGALPAMLNSIAEFYEEDVQNALATAMALIEPVILIVMARSGGLCADLAVFAHLQPGAGAMH
jgi:type IV pilus assembly protein PilC